LTRYLRKGRIAGVAGLASLAVWAVPAAPAGASVTSVCTGTPPYQTCHDVTTIKLGVVITVVQTSSGPLVKVKITVTDPFVVAKLYRKVGTKYRLVKTVFKGNLTGTKKLKIHPKKKGKYELKVKATVAATSTTPAATKTVKKFFTVK